jgi:predicted ATP-grasp superfamily ATP-dependent carboligase
MRALVLDGDTRAALSIVRSLGRRGIRVTAASEDEVSLAGSSRWCSERQVYPCPRSSPQPFLEWLISTLSSEPDTVLYTSSDVTTSIVGRSRLSLPAAARAILPPQRSLEVAMDKAATMDLALQLSVPTPKSVEFGRQEDIDVSRVKFGYPVAVKASQSDLPYRSATTFAGDPEELRLVLGGFLRDSSSALAQEVIPGEGTAIFALCDSGRTLVSFAHRRLIEKPPWGGVGVVTQSINPPADTLRFALRILRELEWHGVAMIEFKRGGAGVPCLMEINPRFWGSLELAVRSGVDFPYLAFRLAAGETVEAPVARRAVNRWVIGELDSLRTALLRRAPGTSRALITHLRSLRYGGCCEVERLSDPRPMIHEYATWLRHSASRLITRRKGDLPQCGKMSVGGG